MEILKEQGMPTAGVLRWAGRPETEEQEEEEDGAAATDPDDHGVTASSGSSRRRRSERHFANVFKSFIGSNYLSIPFAFSAAGAVLGPLAVFAIAAISGYGCLLLVGIRKQLLRKQAGAAAAAAANGKSGGGGGGLDTYPQVAGRVLGPTGHYLAELFLALTQFGYCVGYTIYCATALQQLAPSLSLGAAIFGVLTIPLALLCAVPDLGRFIPFSAASNLALSVGFLAVVAASAQASHRSRTFHFAAAVDGAKLPLAFGNLVASFEGIGTVLPVEGAMAHDGVRGSYPRLLRRTLLAIAGLFSVFGVVGYGGFGPGLCSVILTNLTPGACADVARVAMLVGLFFTYGFQMFPVLEMIDLRLARQPSQIDDADDELSSGGASPTHPDGRPLLHDASPHHHQRQQPKEERDGSGAAATAATTTMTMTTGAHSEGYGALHTPPGCHDDDGNGSRNNKAFDAWVRWLCPPPGHYSRRRPWAYLGVRAAVVLAASLLAYLVPEFELVVAFVGSLGASMLAFVLPGAMAWRLWPEASRARRVGFAALAVFGLVGGGVGSGYALVDLARGKSQC